MSLNQRTVVFVFMTVPTGKWIWVSKVICEKHTPPPLLTHTSGGLVVPMRGGDTGRAPAKSKESEGLRWQ